MNRWAVAFVAATCTLAQDAVPPPSAPARTDVAEWAYGLTDRFQRYTNRVVSAHALAGLAAAVCPHNKVNGAQTFRLAIARIDGIPLADFDGKTTPVLPVASFTRLWRSTEANALKCDPTLASAYDKQRMEDKIDSERGKAPVRLGTAFDIMDEEMKLVVGLPERADRAAQLVESALDLARESDDLTLAGAGSVGSTLSMVRDRFPDGADRVFRYALEVLVGMTAPSTGYLNELAKYLFVAPRLREQADWQYASSGSDYRAIRYSTNPDLIEAMIAALLAIAEKGGANYDTGAAYSLTYQLIPKARDLELNSVGQLERLLATLPTNAQLVASLGGSAADPGAGEPGARRDRTIRQALRAASSGRIQEARNLASGIDDTRVAGHVAGLIAFADAREAISRKDWERAPALANLLPSGVKRSLLYAGIMAAAPRSLVLQEVSLQVRDAEPLPAEFRIALFCAGSQAMAATDAEQALLLLTQAVASANDTIVRKLEARFDPAGKRTMVTPGGRVNIFSVGAATDTDVPLIALGEATIQQAVDGGVARHYFQLTIPGVGAYSLPAAFAAARKLDFRRLEAIALNLREEKVQARALLAIAASQLQVQ